MEPSAQIKMCVQMITQFFFMKATVLNVRSSSIDPITWTTVIRPTLCIPKSRD
jgi:hypothetical protein